MEKLLEILSDLKPEIDFLTNTRLIDDKILDSFDIITIVSEISDEFDVEVPVNQILPENFNSAKALYEMIERLEDAD
ncbi:MAG: phosphopantetheine-binding protein [Oscillospiraceae bacterium]